MIATTFTANTAACPATTAVTEQGAGSREQGAGCRACLQNTQNESRRCAPNVRSRARRSKPRTCRREFGVGVKVRDSDFGFRGKVSGFGRTGSRGMVRDRAWVARDNVRGAGYKTWVVPPAVDRLAMRHRSSSSKFR